MSHAREDSAEVRREISVCDRITADEIQRYLKPEYKTLHLKAYAQVSSTNTLLREAALEGAPEGCVILSEAQTAGRGRMGHRFYSPADTGVYMSLLLRPADWPAAEAVRITTMAAAAACEAVEETASRRPGIKWVNDILLDGRKIAGILTEGTLNPRNGRLDFAILGIGINVYPPEGGFPNEIKDIAGAVFDSQQKDGKNRLAAAFLNHFLDYYKAPDKSAYLEAYRSRSLALGRRIKVLADGGAKEALALDIDPDCHLLVRYGDGSTGCLSSGEISIQLSSSDADCP